MILLIVDYDAAIGGQDPRVPAPCVRPYARAGRTASVVVVVTFTSDNDDEDEDSDDEAEFEYNNINNNNNNNSVKQRRHRDKRLSVDTSVSTKAGKCTQLHSTDSSVKRQPRRHLGNGFTTSDYK